MKLANDEDFVKEDWYVLQSIFPAGWEQLASETGAIKGLRKNKSAENLLRTLLLHIGCGYSLRETAVRARVAGLADLSDVALLKRLRKARPWLQELASRLFLERDPRIPPDADMNVRVIDSSVICEPGKTGSRWRLHYGLQLPSLECDYFEITPVEGTGNGEILHRYPIEAGDYLMADRGYCSIDGIVYAVADCEAYLLVRCKLRMPFVDTSGAKFNILDHLKKLDQPGVTGSWPVNIRSPKGRTVTGRLCAIRKSEIAISQAQKRLHQKASRKQVGLHPEALEAAKYVAVFTTFPEAGFSAAEVLEWYRVRWQIELVFKRFKSIAQLGHLPKHDEESSKAWLYGKLFLALATERVIHLASDFSPWGYPLFGSPSAKPLA